MKPIEKAVFVEWIDSQYYNTGWTNKSDLHDSEFHRIYTIGWVVDESEEQLRLTMSTDGIDKMLNMFVIPKGCIVKLIDLGETEDKAKSTDGKTKEPGPK